MPEMCKNHSLEGLDLILQAHKIRNGLVSIVLQPLGNDQLVFLTLRWDRQCPSGRYTPHIRTDH